MYKREKAPVFRLRLLRLFDAWQLYDGLPARHPSGGAARRANSLPANLSYSRRAFTDKRQINEKAPCFRMRLFVYLMSGSSLLSHGETPHYHRRYGVSLLSSAWGQVGPPRSCRQANLVARNESFMHILRYFPHAAQSHTCVCSFSSIRSVPCLCTKSFVSADS